MNRVVTDVSTHYASVMSLLHSKSFVGVRFTANQQLGSLKWKTVTWNYFSQRVKQVSNALLNVGVTV